MFKDIVEQVNKIRQEKPLILNLTNVVTMDLIANGLLSVGASPVISKSQQDIDDLMQHARALVINIGTLDEPFIKLCRQACQLANQLNLPIVLDPVGAGASAVRTDTALSLMHDYRIAIIRGNASEIMALAGLSRHTKGVDSMAASAHAIDSAKTLSSQYHAAILVSGKIDIIVDKALLCQHERGSAFMPMVTGSGCLLTAVVAAFHAVNPDRFNAASQAALFYSVCGEMAEKKSSGPGSFKVNFLDALHEKH